MFQNNLSDKLFSDLFQFKHYIYHLIFIFCVNDIIFGNTKLYVYEYIKSLYGISAQYFIWWWVFVQM